MKPQLIHMQYASGYSLDLYCDAPGNHDFNDVFPHQYVGETFAECVKQAKKYGWKIHYKTRTATCPKCARN